MKPRCFARVSVPHSPVQTSHNKQKRSSGRGQHAATRPRRQDGWRTALVSEPLVSSPHLSIPFHTTAGKGWGGIGTLGASQSQPSSRRLQRRGNEGCVIACSGLGMHLPLPRQRQADKAARIERARRPSRRNGSSNERFLLWGGKERGLTHPRTQQPPQQLLFPSPLTINTPQTIHITLTSTGNLTVFFYLIELADGAGGYLSDLRNLVLVALV